MLRNTSDVCPVFPTIRQPRRSPLQISSRCSRPWRVDRPVAPTHGQTRRQQRHRRRLSGNLSPYTVNGISCFRPSQSGRLVSTVNFTKTFCFFLDLMHPSGISVAFLPLDSLSKLPEKQKYSNFFHTIYFSARFLSSNCYSDHF